MFRPHLGHTLALLEISALQDGHGTVSAMAAPRLVVEHLLTVGRGPECPHVHTTPGLTGCDAPRGGEDHFDAMTDRGQPPATAYSYRNVFVGSAPAALNA